MGKAQTKSTRKRRSKASSSPKTKTTAGATTKRDDSNNDYESFPISNRRSRSNESFEAGGNLFATMGAPLPPHNITKAESSLEDPGNPLGNAVDFCISNINALHVKTMKLNFPNYIGATFVLKPCQEKSTEKLLEDLLLCNNLAGRVRSNERITNIESSIEEEKTEFLHNDTALEDSMARSSSKRGKHGWKKTMMIVPGKTLLRSMSLKRKISSTPNNSKLEDDIWKGITEETKPEGDGIFTMDSDEDTLFTNLEHDGTWNTAGSQSHDPIDDADSQFQSKPMAASEEKKLDEEALETQEDGGNDNISCHNFFSTSSLCALSSSLQNSTVEVDATSETGELMISRDLENQKPMHTVQTDASRSTKAPRKPKIKIVETPSSRGIAGKKNSSFNIYNDDGEEDAKVEFEMVLDDSRSRHRKWGNITPWKKMESFFANSSSSSPASSNGRRRRRNSRSLSMGSHNSTFKTTNEEDLLSHCASVPKRQMTEKDSTELELILDDVSLSRNAIEPRSTLPPGMVSQRSARVMRKRRMQSALFGFSTRSRRQTKTSSSISKNRRSSWKKMLVVSVPPEHYRKSPRTETRSGTSVAYGKTRTLSSKEEKSMRSLDPSTESDPLQYSESDEETMATHSACTIITVEDRSSTSVTGLHEWSWGVFNMNPKEEDMDSNNHSRKSIDIVSIPLFGGGGDDSATDYTPQTGIDSRSGGDLSFSCADEDDTYFNGTHHDSWIMNEDQLEFFEDEDDSRKTGHCSGYTSTNGSLASYDKDDDDDDTTLGRDFQETPKKATKAASKREGFLAISKSIRKSFAHKRNKSKGTIDVSSDISVNAESFPDEKIDSECVSTTIEAVLMPKRGRGPFTTFSSSGSKKPTTAPTEGRDDGFTTTPVRNNRGNSNSHTARSKRSSLATSGAAFSKAKNFWKLQSSNNSNPPQPKRSVATTSASSSTIAASSAGNRRRRWSTRSGSTPSNVAESSQQSDIITILTKQPNTNNTSSAATVATASSSSTAACPHLDQYAVSLLDQENDIVDYDDDDRSSAYDESTATSASTNSRSWARDDEDTQSEDFLYYGFNFSPSHNDVDVIRE